MSNIFQPSGWQNYILPSSFNGVPFYIKSARTELTRKQVEHDFAFSDTVYIEDLGRGAQRVSFDAFLTGLGLYSIRTALDNACNQSGPGILVHPSYGEIAASLISVSYGEEVGNVIDVNLEFYITQNYTFAQLYQTIANNTQSTSITNALNLIGNIENDASTFTATVLEAENGVNTVVAVVNKFGALITTAINTSTNTISNLIGLSTVISSTTTLGRYATGSAVNPPVISGLSGLTSQSAIIAAASSSLQTSALTAQAKVLTDITTMNSDAASNPANIATDIVQAMNDFQASILDPAQQIASLIPLCSFTSTTQVVPALASIEAATAAICRRAALSALANAVATYQPSSTTGAYAIITAIRPVFNNEILYAGSDASMGDVYQSLVALSQSVISDLQTRATGLPSLVQKTFNVSLPSVIIAQLLYGDATRQDEIVSFNNEVVSPLFMNTTIFALSQ